MKNLTLVIISAASAITVSVAAGFNYILIWNLLPAVAFYFITKKYFNNWKVLKISSKICLILLVLFLIIFPTISAVMWIFDVEEAKSGSSTAGLIFIFIPIYAFLFSLIPFIILISMGIRHNNRQNNEH
jgi:hypothetical protein